MPEIANGMWRFKGEGHGYSSTIYLRDDEIIGAIVDDVRVTNPHLTLLTLHSGTVNINWAKHHMEIINYIEGNCDAREDNRES